MKSKASSDPYEGRALITLKEHGHSLLTIAQERVVVDFIGLQARLGSPIQPSSLPEAANTLFGKTNLDQYWARRFLLKHNDELKKTKEKPMAVARRSSKVINNVNVFAKAYKEIVGYYGVTEKRVFNCDETLISAIQGNKGPDVLLGAVGKPSANKKINPSSIGCALPFVAADGTLMTLIFCFQTGTSKTAEVSVPTERRGSRASNSALNTHFLATASGYLDKEAFQRATELFVHDLQRSGMNNLEILVVCDNLRQHLDAKNLAFAYKNNVHFMFLPPNTSHVTQPLDQQPFALFKRNIASSVKKKLEWLADDVQTNEHQRDVLVSSLEEAAIKSFSKQIVVSSFRKIGIWPVDIPLLKQNVQEVIDAARPATAGKKDPNSIEGMVDASFERLVQKRKIVSDLVKNSVRRVSVSTNYTDKSNSRDLLEKEKQAAEEKAERVAQKQKRRENRLTLRCRGPHKDKAMPPKYPKKDLKEKDESKRWIWCDCDAYGLCPICRYDEEAKAGLKTHEDGCKVAKDRKNAENEEDGVDDGNDKEDADTEEPEKPDE